MPTVYRHFAYRAVREIEKRFPGKSTYVVEAGVTPSGKIHLGNFNDVVIADAVLRALEDEGYDSKGYLVIDSMDPLRQAPSFAPDEFKRSVYEYVGRPFERIPDPWGCHGNYAEHFVKPIEESFEEYGISLNIIWAREIHLRDVFIKHLLRVIEEREEVRRILNEIRAKAGHTRLYPEEWIPYRPLCSRCGRIDEAVKPIEVVGEGVIKYMCGACGDEGVANVRRGEGKPPWRIDWPLRWVTLDVHFEPLGKDHMASGSGYDTGCALLREFFHREPPVPVFYDFVYWVERKGDEKVYMKFSKRRGVGLGAEEWIKYAPPEVLRFQILKRDVRDLYREALSHWYFDFRLIPSYVEEFDAFEERYFESKGGQLLKDTYMLSLVREHPPRKPRRVSYNHLVRIAAWMEDLDDGMRMLARQRKLEGMAEWEVEDARKRLLMASNWLKEVGLTAALQSPDQALKALRELDRKVLRAFIEVTREILSGAEPREVGNVVRTVAGKLGLRTRRDRLLVYRAFYQAILGEDEGPPLRRLLARSEVLQLLAKLLNELECNIA
ncbi:MAG: lysine--tRNA ligase [Thermoprotei archaeon]|nr:MAG: lysine--tRNA ligase [Thermoprotei archaeon]